MLPVVSKEKTTSMALSIMAETTFVLRPDGRGSGAQ